MYLTFCSPNITFTTIISPWQYRNTYYLLHDITLHGMYLNVAVIPSFNRSITVQAREDFEVPHLDYSCTSNFIL